jgi:phage/plasmid-like protein (TIGR03299 family)
MSANVEQWGKMASFASLRSPAWWDIDGAFTVDKPMPIMAFAGEAHLLGWDVRKVNLADVLPSDFRFTTETHLIVRTNPYDQGTDVFGPVGRIFEPYQNEELAELAVTFGSGDYRAETMGALGNGATVFMSFAHPDDIVLDPNGGADRIKRYVMLHMRHDGTGKVTGRKCNTRVVCKNTLNVAIGESSPDFAAKHSPNMRDRIKIATELAGYVDAYDAVFEAEAQLLYARPVTDSAFWGIVKDVFPEPDKDVKGSLAKWTSKTDTLVSTWNGATGSMGNLPKNAWRALQAFTEHNQWQRQLRSDNVDNALAAGAGFDPVTNAFRQSIHDRILTVTA